MPHPIAKRVALAVVILAFAGLLLPRCARIMAPTGGPKDTLAPVLVRSTPPHGATHFLEDRASITFDEFVQLREAMQKMLLSPPQAQLPEIVHRGRRIDFKFYEPLREHTTYTLYLTDAIVDNNEGNPLHDFTLAFATGPTFDSLALRGRVIDAFTLKPVGGVLVMLYDRFEDSIPIIQKPRHATRTNKQGEFTLRNLFASDYKIFALADLNNNYLFDQRTERIAFDANPLPSAMLIEPSAIPAPAAGSAQPAASAPGYTLRLFEELSPVHALTDFRRPTRRSFALGFTRRPQGGVSITPIGPAPTAPWFILERSRKGDTLTHWITDSAISALDTLRILASYYITDSLLALIPAADTLQLLYTPREAPPERHRDRAREEEEERAPTAPVHVSVAPGTSVRPTQPIRFTMAMPPLGVDTALIALRNMTDTLPIHGYQFQPDSLNPRHFYLSHEWLPQVRYELEVLPGAFRDLDGLTNDTLRVAFRGVNPADFGLIRLTVQGVASVLSPPAPPAPAAGPMPPDTLHPPDTLAAEVLTPPSIPPPPPLLLVDLLTERGELVERQAANPQGQVTFAFIRPGRYSFRFIADANGNGQWDTGNYLQGIQPERVMVWEEQGRPRLHAVRANWEYELNHTLCVSF